MLRRILDSPWPYFVGAGILLVVAIATQVELRIPSRYDGTVEDIQALRDRSDLNVVFILIDTLRADRLGIYGYERETSRVLDDLGRCGVVFKRVVSQSSWTKTSMASLWTATHPVNNGILRFNQVIPEEARMPAEVFREAGYRTAGIWRNGWVAPNFGFSQGFDIYLRPQPGRSRARVQRRNPTPHPLIGTDEDLTHSAFEFLDNFGQERFFLYMHMMDLHQYVFDEGAADFGPSYSDSYDRSVNWTDRVVGAIIEKLDALGLLTKTLIVVTSDHGEAFQEHGSEGHAKNLYEEVTAVPLIIAFPFLLKPGIVVESTVSIVDLWPTVLDLVGLPPLPGVDGVSLVPLILEGGGAPPPSPTDGLIRPVFSQLDQRWGTPEVEPQPLVAVTQGNLRLIYPVLDPRRAELYDHASDPLETRNLLREDPAAGAELRESVSQYLENPTSPWGREPGEVELDGLRLEQLRALGYHVR